VVQALWIGHSYFALYPQDRIPVRRGDVIGIYFPRYNPTTLRTFRGSRDVVAVGGFLRVVR